MAIKKVFITGGTGLVGSLVVDELLKHGYILTGLARSDASADILQKKGVTPVRGTLTDLDILAKAAKDADATIHLGFVYNFEDFESSCLIDRAAVEAIVESLAGTGKTFIGTGGLLKFPEDFPKTIVSKTRMDTWKISLSYASKNVRSIQINLPPTCHGENDHVLLPTLIKVAKENKVVVYPDDGSNNWAAANIKDLAVFYRLALEQGESGKTIFADAESVSSKEIATAIAKKYDLPLKSVPADKMFEASGYIGMLFTLNSYTTEGERPFGWRPTHPTLLEDIAKIY